MQETRTNETFCYSNHIRFSLWSFTCAPCVCGSIAITFQFTFQFTYGKTKVISFLTTINPKTHKKENFPRREVFWIKIEFTTISVYSSIDFCTGESVVMFAHENRRRRSDRLCGGKLIASNNNWHCRIDQRNETLFNAFPFILLSILSMSLSRYPNRFSNHSSMRRSMKTSQRSADSGFDQRYDVGGMSHAYSEMDFRYVPNGDP